jgi:hypothetical protein
VNLLRITKVKKPKPIREETFFFLKLFFEKNDFRCIDKNRRSIQQKEEERWSEGPSSQFHLLYGFFTDVLEERGESP